MPTHVFKVIVCVCVCQSAPLNSGNAAAQKILLLDLVQCYEPELSLSSQSHPDHDFRLNVWLFWYDFRSDRAVKLIHWTIL